MALTAYKAEHKGACAWVHVDVLESAGWRGLGLAARRVLDRLLIENARHRYQENGKLRVSMRQFAGQDKGRKHVIEAIRELEKAGLLAVAKDKPHGKFAPANLYRLKFLGTIDGPATWREKSFPTPQKDTEGTTQKDTTRENSDACAPSGEPGKNGRRLPPKRIPSLTCSSGTLVSREQPSSPDQSPSASNTAAKRGAEARPRVERTPSGGNSRDHEKQRAARKPAEPRLVCVSGGFRLDAREGEYEDDCRAIEAKWAADLIRANFGERWDR
jgi:hypothetical protein